MIRFESDYIQGAHEAILRRMAETAEEQNGGYGIDKHCEAARTYIKAACQAPNADVHFLVGGTQANMTVIHSYLRPYQGVLSADTGHIYCHETAAVEGTGHKVLPLPGNDGKITAQQVKDACDAHYNDASHEHLAQPAMVYISQTTENGTCYTLAELEEMRRVTKECGLMLFIDGARLGYALASPDCDVTLPDMARLCDVFYIGGTKVGALMGEAVVITNDALKKDFRYMIKNCGGMLAKGWLLGIQFETLFENGLYFEIGQHAATLATRIHNTCKECGYPFYFGSESNQQFPIFPNDLLAKLEEKYVFNYVAAVDATHTAVRICTSWATKEEHVDALLADIRAGV